MRAVDQVVGVHPRLRRDERNVRWDDGQRLPDDLLGRQARTEQLTRMHANHRLDIRTLRKVSQGLAEPVGHAASEDLSVEGQAVPDDVRRQEDDGADVIQPQVRSDAARTLPLSRLPAATELLPFLAPLASPDERLDLLALGRCQARLPPRLPQVIGVQPHGLSVAADPHAFPLLPEFVGHGWDAQKPSRLIDGREFQDAPVGNDDGVIGLTPEQAQCIAGGDGVARLAEREQLAGLEVLIEMGRFALEGVLHIRKRQMVETVRKIGRDEVGRWAREIDGTQRPRRLKDTLQVGALASDIERVDRAGPTSIGKISEVDGVPLRGQEQPQSDAEFQPPGEVTHHQHAPTDPTVGGKARFLHSLDPGREGAFQPAEGKARGRWSLTGEKILVELRRPGKPTSQDLGPRAQPRHG